MGMKARKRLWRWVTRDDEGSDVEVWSARKKPQKQDRGYEGYYDYYRDERKSWSVASDPWGPMTICKEEFEKLFGELPPTNKPVKIEFSAKRLG